MSDDEGMSEIVTVRLSEWENKIAMLKALMAEYRLEEPDAMASDTNILELIGYCVQMSNRRMRR